MIGPFGSTTCIVLSDANIVHRGLRVRGMVISMRSPYSDEVAALDALTTLHDWLHSTGLDQQELYSMTIKAGSYQPIGALQNWFAGGILALQSAAASPLVEDVLTIESWLRTRLDLRPFAPPTETDPNAALPMFRLQVLTFFEECLCSLRCPSWVKPCGLPCHACRSKRAN